MRKLGCHVSVSGGLVNGLKNGQALGVNCIQVHPSPPQRWNSKPFAEGIEADYLELLPMAGIDKVFFHGIYLINLANPDPRNMKLSELSLAHDVELANRIKGEGVVFHVGSMKHMSDASEGFKQAAGIINTVFESSPGRSKLFLEVAAGSGFVIGQKIEELLTIYEQVKDQDRLGLCLDTQHLWASGNNLEDHLEVLLEKVASAIGLEKIGAIHLNDSKTACGSKVDRHENLGQGLIGEERLKRVINHPKLRAIPLILETPGLKELESAKLEVAVLKEWAQS